MPAGLSAIGAIIRQMPRHLLCGSLRVANRQTLPAKKRSRPQTMKSVSSQFISLVNCIATSWHQKKQDRRRRDPGEADGFLVAGLDILDLLGHERTS